MEKPTTPPSNVAIGGIYLFDENFWEILDEEMTRAGNDFSITDVNKRYLQMDKITLKNLDEEVWLDCGTPDNLLEAAKFAREEVLNPMPCNYKSGDSRIGWAE